MTTFTDILCSLLGSSKSAEERQSGVVRVVIGRGAEGISWRWGWRERLGIGAEGSAAWRVVWGIRTVGGDVKVFVKLSDCRSHFSFVGVRVEWPGIGVSRVSSEHRQLFHWSCSCFLLRRLNWSTANLIKSVDKVASWTIGTESNTVVGAAEVCLVFGVSGDGSQLEISMRELALVSVLASAVLLEWAAHLGFVSVSILDRLGLAAAGGLGASLALASVELTWSTGSNWAIPV